MFLLRSENGFISMESLYKISSICSTLKGDVCDVMVFIDEGDNKQS